MYFANTEDLPASWKSKRLVFYAMGLKVYGCMPYLLQKRLKARFVSNCAGIGGGGRIFWPAAESNYTIVPYRKPDGSKHNQKVLESFFEWLYDGKGFEFAIADEENFYDDISYIGIFEWPPSLRAATLDDKPLIFRLIEGKGQECEQ